MAGTGGSADGGGVDNAGTDAMADAAPDGAGEAGTGGTGGVADDAGSGGAGGNAGNTGSGGNAVVDAGRDTGSKPAASSSGCGCEVGQPTSFGSWGLMLLGLAMVLFRSSRGRRGGDRR
jgi:MYXO-CTERM domain-containing protein